MFAINDYIRQQIGYFATDNICVCKLTEDTGEYDIEIAKVEFFGAAVRISYFSDGRVENFFSEEVSCTIVSMINDNYIIRYNDVLLIVDIESYTSLQEYARVVNENKDYFYSQYQNCTQINDLEIDICNNQTNDINSLSGSEFEQLCCSLISKMGFEVELTQASRDGGIDIIARNNQPFVEGVYIVQCKRYSGVVGEPIIRDLYGVVSSERANKGILITTGTFTKDAVNFAKGKQIELIDGTKLTSLLEAYQLNSTVSQNVPSNLQSILEEEFYLDEYNDAIKILNSNPKNDIVRLNLIYKLTDFIFGLIRIEDQTKIKIILPEIKKHISLYSKNRDKNNKKKKYMDAVLTVLYMDLSIIEGDFVEAINKYLDLVKRPEMCVDFSDKNYNKDFESNLWMYVVLYTAAYSAIKIAALSNNIVLLENICTISRHIIDGMKYHHEAVGEIYCNEYTDRQISYARSECERIKNIRTPDSFAFIDSFAVTMATKFAYYDGDSFPFTAEYYSIEKKEKSLIVNDEDGKLFVEINNLNESILEVMKNF